MSTETHDTFLHSQLQEGLQYDLLKGPAVSGAQSYQGLRLAAKNEEKRQAELKKGYCTGKETVVHQSRNRLEHQHLLSQVGGKETLQRSSVSTVVQITCFEIAISQRRRVVVC